MGGLSRASPCGEAGSREREKGEFRESRAGCVPEAGKGRGGSLGRAGQGVPPNWRGRVDRGVGGELGGHASLRLSGLEEPENSSSGCRWKSLRSCWDNARGEEDRGRFLGGGAACCDFW